MILAMRYDMSKDNEVIIRASKAILNTLNDRSAPLTALNIKAGKKR